MHSAPTVVDYCVISEHDDAALVKRVQQLLTEGWTPQGDLSVVAPVLDGVVAPLYSQAMVKRG
jgi:hypothetical protein